VNSEFHWDQRADDWRASSISICSSPQMLRPSASVIRYQMKEPGELRWSRFAWAMRALIAAATVRWVLMRV